VGWFVTVDGNAHVKRHVRRRRSDGGGGGTKGGCHREPRGMAREAVGIGGVARVWSGSSLVGGCCIDRESGLK